jgi:hypothetical protein
MAGHHFGNWSESRLNYLNMADRTWRNLSVGVSTPPITAAGTGRTSNIKVDPVRRLLIASCEIAPHVRAFDLATLGRTGAPEPTPSEGTGGWWHLPITAAPGFSIDAATNPAMRINNLGWHFYPPNGKYYRCIPNLVPKPEDLDEYNALGDFHFTRLQRLTPPAIIADPPESYYVTEPWVYDEIEVGSAEQQPDSVAIPLPRSPYHNQDSAIGNKWFWYVPALQCFAYFPLDNGSNGGSPIERSVSRHCVYLIKPY